MIRIILYGYQIQDGKLVLQPQEAEVVKRIFSIYLKGTYQWKIADILNADGVVYSQERPQWTMHRVGFILKNPRYMGVDDYPVIVSSEALKRRFSGHKRNDTLYLQCEGCGFRAEIKDTDFLAEMERQVASHTPSEQLFAAYELSVDAVRLTNAINRGLERPEEIVKLILQGVSAR